MCGRFARTSPLDVLRAELGIDRTALADLAPRYNVCPGEAVAAVIESGDERRLGLLKWGLPSPLRARPLINARAETVASRPSFRDAFRRRRCLVPADAFYEWQAGPAGKTPWLLGLRDGGAFTFAAIWETAGPGAGPDRWGCALLTCEPNELVAPIHSRMPVIVPPENRDTWLDPSSSAATLKALLVPLPAEAMRAHPVRPLVNSPRNDSPECMEPVALTAPRR